jgi:hypothetical protein
MSNVNNTYPKHKKKKTVVIILITSLWFNLLVSLSAEFFPELFTLFFICFSLYIIIDELQAWDLRNLYQLCWLVVILRAPWSNILDKMRQTDVCRA